MSKSKRPLHVAEAIAAEILADLAPHCTRISVAGSVRRRKAEVGDLELVAIPGQALGGLFGDMPTNALHAHLSASNRYRFLKGDNPEGRYYQLAVPAYADLQVDLFLAEADNWGLILLVRTGSAEFSTAVLARWKRRQGIGPEQAGSVGGRLVRRDGEVVPTPDEETIFTLLGVPFIPPEQRHEGLPWLG